MGDAWHEPYIKQVIEQIEKRGIAVHEWYADDNDPLDAAAHLDTGHDPEVPEEPQRWIAWTEERGWFTGRAADAGQPLDQLRYAELGVLPEPFDVAEWARRITEGDVSGTIEPTRYRDMDDDETEFRKRLHELGKPGRGVVL